MAGEQRCGAQHRVGQRCPAGAALVLTGDLILHLQGLAELSIPLWGGEISLVCFLVARGGKSLRDHQSLGAVLLGKDVQSTKRTCSLSEVLGSAKHLVCTNRPSDRLRFVLVQRLKHWSPSKALVELCMLTEVFGGRRWQA